MLYKHTQKGYLMLWILISVFLLYGFLVVLTGIDLLYIAIMFLVFFILASFLSLTISVDKDQVHLKFGCGIFKKSFALQDIVSAKTVKNHWYYGWGIHLVFWPTMWIYNVSGFDAVEIILKNGKCYRLGTDEPEKLEQAILQSLL